MTNTIKYFVTALLIGSFDRLVKFFVNRLPSLDLYFIKIQPAQINSGLSLSLPVNNYIVIVLSFITIAALIIIFNRIKNNEKYYFAAIIGAASSNLIDRLLFGGVIDYINLLNLSVINFADIVISLSVLVLIAKRLRVNKYRQLT